MEFRPFACETRIFGLYAIVAGLVADRCALVRDCEEPLRDLEASMTALGDKE